MLAGVGNAILSVQLKVEALCEVVYQQATRIVETGNFQIGLFEGSDYAIKVWLKDAERLPPQRFAGKADEGIIGWVRRTGTGLLVRDFQREWDTLPARPTEYTHKPARSAIFAPLIAGGNTIGVIAVQSARADMFTDEDMRLLTLLANQASAAIRNAQIFEATQERARQLRLINEVSRQVTAIQPLPDLFRQIVTLIRDAFGYYAVSIFILDEKTNILHSKASSHQQFRGNAPGARTRSGLDRLGGGAPTDHPVPQRESGRTLPAQYGAGRHPLRDRRAAQGAEPGGRVCSTCKATGWTPSAMTTCLCSKRWPGRSAMALQEAETYNAERRQTERINAMTEVARAVVSILDIDDLLDEVVDLVSESLGYDRVHLFLRVGERMVFRSGSGVYSGRWALEKVAYSVNGDGLIARVARSGQPEISGDIRD